MQINDWNTPVAQNVVQIIAKRGLKQVAVASKACYSAQTLNDMLNGRKIIKAADVMRLASALGVTPNELFKAPEG